jgi:hypothetical protein
MYIFDVCCEKLRRYSNNIIDKSLFFLMIRQNGEVNRFLAKKWRRNGEVNRSLVK